MPIEILGKINLEEVLNIQSIASNTKIGYMLKIIDIFKKN
ncbi:2835_t:CDS:2 [Funneliformis geosporum]|uniref:2835_t:CDS:1 n=1 Tax=Funneliformis geosporum TaxID=1117311 RepID=A0A9W4SAW5_9GLOM|nr:2835_t:CDS:2 [Funneliformis geosporum]